MIQISFLRLQTELGVFQHFSSELLFLECLS